MKHMIQFVSASLIVYETDPAGFFGGIKGTVTSWLNAFVDNFLIYIGVLICGVFFIINLIKCVTDYNEGHGDQMKGKIIFMLVLVVIAALLLAKNAWWGFIFGG